MSDAKGSGNVNTGTLAGADAASMAAVEKSAGMLLPGRSVGHISILSQTFNHIESTFRDPGSNVGIVAPTLGLPPAGPGTLLPVTSDCIIAAYFTPRPSAIGGALNWSTQHFIMMQKDGVLKYGISNANQIHSRTKSRNVGSLAAWGIPQINWTGI
jgi:hypothetical protein